MHAVFIRLKFDGWEQFIDSGHGRALRSIYLVFKEVDLTCYKEEYNTNCMMLWIYPRPHVLFIAIYIHLYPCLCLWAIIIDTLDIREVLSLTKVGRRSLYLRLHWAESTARSNGGTSCNRVSYAICRNKMSVE